jgi:hypothetical protein
MRTEPGNFFKKLRIGCSKALQRAGLVFFGNHEAVLTTLPLATVSTG